MNNSKHLDDRFVVPLDPRQLYFSLALIATWLGYRPEHFRRLCKREGIPIKYPSSGRKPVVKYAHVLDYVESCDGLSDDVKAQKLEQLERGRAVRSAS